MFKYTLLFMLLVASQLLTAGNPEELGKVAWLRDLDQAQKKAVREQKPILILFQEIPGCLTCRTYGSVVLSHPLIVETIETYFVPLAIYNNRGGKDADVLNYYQEPSWNNPVVRIVNQDKKDVLARLNGNYTPSGLVNYMIMAMKKMGHQIPDYLPLLFEELKANERGLEKTTLSMYCFWTGEKELGKIDGVMQTEAGFMDHREVVNVYFDPNVVNLESILNEGKKTQCADQIYYHSEEQKHEAKVILGEAKMKTASKFSLDREPKYYLAQTVYKHIPMTPTQAVKINALVGQGKSPVRLLSPRQKLMLNHLKDGVDVAWSSSINDKHWEEKMYKAWKELVQRA